MYTRCGGNSFRLIRGDLSPVPYTFTHSSILYTDRTGAYTTYRFGFICLEITFSTVLVSTFLFCIPFSHSTPRTSHNTGIWKICPRLHTENTLPYTVCGQNDLTRLYPSTQGTDDTLSCIGITSTLY